MARKDTIKALTSRGISEETTALLLTKYTSLTAIAVHCEKIIEDPSTGVVRSHRQPSALSQVLAFLKDHDVRLRRIAMLSLLKVFNDILPVLSRGNCHLELPHPPRHRRGKGGTAQARGPADPPIRGVLRQNG